MSTRTRSSLLAPALCALSLFCILPTAHAQHAYDASLNTLPESQGWTYIGSYASPAPSVSGGVLFQDNLTNNATQAWKRTDIVNDFNIGAPKFFFETNIKVDQ